MIPLTDERLKQIAYDEIVCVTDQVRAMAAELLAARADIAALETAARMDNEVIRQANEDRADQAKSIAYLARGRDQARARIAELEAAQRPPLGYVVGFTTSQGGLTFARDYGGPDPTRAGAEQEMAHYAEEDSRTDWKLLEVREVQS